METLEKIKVDKSQLTDFSFGINEKHVPNVSSLLRYKLHRALILGNFYKSHSLIQFYDEDGSFMETEATVWAVTDKYIMIKGGTVIPIKSIIDLKF